jgi:ribose/xylose/arabinose/galactoside ABC-type transport system permease subunit/ABC-type cobalamin/Fe3+-siderophores transport system ATPase subunit
LDGRDITPRSCSAAIEAGLAYLTEDRKADGLALRLPVIDNVLAALRPGRNEPLPHQSAGARKAAGLADRLDLQPRRLDRDVASLSGGNQQKALLAKWLATEPDVLFLDEPTRGVDVGAKLAIHRAIERLADQGRCVVLISSDLPELVGLSDRVLIMREGRLARDIAGDACSEEGVLMAAYGHEPQLRSEAAAADPGPAPPASPQCADGAHGTTSPDEIGRATGARAWAIRLALVLALIVAARVVAPQFMSADNLLTVLQTVALLGIVSCGVCFVTYSGHYADLSAPSTMALAGIVSVSVLGHGIVAALAAGLAAGLAVGLVNGVAIGRLRVNPIIWTLATGAGVGGLIRWAYSGTQVYPDAGTAAGRAFLGLYGIRLFGTVPVSVVVLGVVAAAAAVLLSRTRFGFHARLTGGAYEAARLSGVNTSVVVERAFLLSGAAAAIGGMLLTSLNKVGAPYVGQGYDFAAVTAVVLGGVGLAGGRGTVPGVLGGVMVIGVLRNVMNLLGWGAFHQDIAQGIVFIVVVGCASALARRKGRADA